ncbi:Crp/Fnr family transcriptional regulator [Candidatus Bipolaricaulota bacterium]|nr:Crp/Fnr family transcriptional regulator [Candidatus Bipolaricaulota bacterium]
MSEQERINLVEHFPIFEHLHKEEIDELERRINWFDCLKGDSLFQQGAPGLGLYLILKGQVKLSHRSRSGKNTTLKISGPGELLGVPTLFNKENYIGYANVLEETSIGFIERNNLFDVIGKNYGVLFGFLAAVSTELMFFQLKLVEAFHSGSKQRISRIILEKKDLGIDVSRTELAELSGVSYKTVIQTINDLEERGVIEKTDENCLEIKREEKLTAIGNDFPIDLEGNKLL